MLTSTQNPLVKQLRQLGQSTQERRSQGLFLIEGTHAVTEAIATNYPLSIVCCTEVWAAIHSQIYRQAITVSARFELVSAEVLGAIATTKNPDGIIAVATSQSQILPQIQTLGLALESIQDPGNLGTLIRSAVAVGIDGLILSPDSVDLTHPKIIRATAGQWFRASMAVAPDLPGAIAKLQQQGICAIATLADAETLYWDHDFSQPSLILLGNEGNGLSAEVTRMADVAIRIPISAQVESLNVGVSGAILLYEAMRQRAQKAI